MRHTHPSLHLLSRRQDPPRLRYAFVAAKAEEHRPAVGRDVRFAGERLAAITGAVDTITEVEAELAAQCEAVQAEVQQRFAHIVEVPNRRKEEVAEALDRRKEEVTEALKRREEEIMAECRQVASGKNGVLVTQRESLQAIVDSMQRSHDMTKETIDRITEIARAAPRLQARTRQRAGGRAGE